MARRASFRSIRAWFSSFAPIAPNACGFSEQWPGAFFCNEDGRRFTDCCARYNFALVSQGIGLRETQRFCKHGRGPRIHDLRHTFAVRTIMDWYRKGLDPDREMLKLSTYLGHAKPDSTYWYIEAVPELLQLASSMRRRALHGDMGGSTMKTHCSRHPTCSDSSPSVSARS